MAGFQLDALAPLLLTAKGIADRAHQNQEAAQRSREARMTVGAAPRRGRGSGGTIGSTYNTLMRYPAASPAAGQTSPQLTTPVASSTAEPDPETKEIPTDSPQLAPTYAGGMHAGVRPDHTKSEALEAEAEALIHPKFGRAGWVDQFANPALLQERYLWKKQQASLARQKELQDFAEKFPQAAPDMVLDKSKAIVRKMPDGTYKTVSPEAPVEPKMFAKPLQSAEGLSWIGNRGAEPIYEKGQREVTYGVEAARPSEDYQGPMLRTEHTAVFQGNMPFVEQPSPEKAPKTTPVTGLKNGKLAVQVVPTDKPGTFQTDLDANREPREPREPQRDRVALGEGPEGLAVVNLDKGTVTSVAGGQGVQRAGTKKAVNIEKIRSDVENSIDWMARSEEDKAAEVQRRVAEADGGQAAPAAAPAPSKGGKQRVRWDPSLNEGRGGVVPVGKR